MALANRPPEVASVRERLAFTVGAVLRATRQPSAWVFVALYGVSAITLVVTGSTSLVAVELGVAVLLIMLVVLTVAVTGPSPHAAPDGESAVATSWRVGMQLGVLGVVVLFTLYGGMVVTGTAPTFPASLIWSRGSTASPRSPSIHCCMSSCPLSCSSSWARGGVGWGSRVAATRGP